MVAVWFLDKLCSLSFCPGSFIPLLPSLCAPIPPSYHYIFLAQQSVSESLFLRMTTMNSWTHHRQNNLLQIPASLMYHIFKYILLLQVKIKASCNCEKKVIFDTADTVNPISQSKPNCFITITNIIHHYRLIIRIKNKTNLAGCDDDGDVNMAQRLYNQIITHFSGVVSQTLPLWMSRSIAMCAPIKIDLQ